MSLFGRRPTRREKETAGLVQPAVSKYAAKVKARAEVGEPTGNALVDAVLEGGYELVAIEEPEPGFLGLVLRRKGGRRGS